ncbi:hypothetical protein RRSWK_01728 [Rhodopirellula sp. SWK7]|nr:hypothetical protein RRSWK_01728 [Rhodopirellula sp. SWK7]
MSPKRSVRFTDRSAAGLDERIETFVACDPIAAARCSFGATANDAIAIPPAAVCFALPKSLLF